jgi:cytochrome c-type biogenesis protein CcmH
MKLALVLGLATALLALPAAARDAAPLAVDEAVEKRMLAITEELRCLVCQNESLAASRADLAQDLRQEIREMIKAGKSDQEIMDFMVSRYGDFVRYRPPLKPATWLLWLGPFVLLAAAVAALMIYSRRRAKMSGIDDMTPLSVEDQARAMQLLQAGPETTDTKGPPE